MPTAASHRALTAKPRHRKCAGRTQAIYPTFRLDYPTSSQTTSSACARHVGRIGALAVALGVGVAVAAHGAGVARADDGASDSSGGSTSAGSSASGSSASGSSTSDTTAEENPSTSASSTTPTKSGSTATSETGSGPTVPDMRVSASGGANTSVGGESGTAGPAKTSTADADPRQPKPETTAEPTKTTATPSVEPTDPAPRHPRPTTTATAGAEPAPTAVPPGVRQELASTPVKTTPTEHRDVVAAPTTTTVDEAVVATEPVAAQAIPTVTAAALTNVPDPVGAPGPGVPVPSPVLWAVLAWTRRESQRDDTSDTTASTTRIADVQAQAVVPTAAYNDIYSTTMDTPVGGNVLTNDTAPVGDTLVVDSHTEPGNGTLTMATDGTFTYQPNAGYVGPDEFTYTVQSLGDGATASTVVSIAVIAPNYPPVAVDDSFTTTSGTPITSYVTFNDSDPEHESIVVVANTNPVHGTVTVDNIGQFTYTPQAGFSGVDAFTYTIQDPRQQTATATVVVTVVPVAGNDSATTQLDTAVSISVLGNDSGTGLTANLSSQASAGTVVDNRDGTFTYTPNTGFVGTDAFGYVATDANGTTAYGAVTVTVTGVVLTAPLVGRDYYDATQGTDLVVPAQWGVLSNDTELDGNPLTATVATQPSNGTVVMAADGSFVYTANAGFLGDDVFTYTATSSTSATNTTTVTITVKAAPNLPPVANFDGYQTNVDTPVLLDLLANDSDPENQPLTARIVTQPDSGTITVNRDGTFTYTPATGFVGLVTFRYAVSDGVNETEAGVAVTVVALNQPPVAADDTATFAWGDQAIVYVLANDGDPDGEEVYITDYGTPTHGTTGGFGGAIEYTPNPDWSGTDTFSYTISDAAGLTSTATVTVTILPPNHAPTANDDEATTTVNTPIDIKVLANDTDPDGDWLTVTIESGPDYGKVTVGKDGTLHYIPAPDWVGTDWINYSVTDPGGLSSYASVKITVTGKDDPGTPSEPNGPWYTAPAGKTLKMPALSGVLGQDLLSQGAGAGLIETTVHGVLQLNKDGSFTYTPDKGFVGIDTFSYFYGTSEWGDGPFTATIEVVPSDGTEVVGGVPAVANTGGGLPSCTDNWFPSQYDRDETWPLCLSPEIRLPNRM